MCKLVFLQFLIVVSSECIIFLKLRACLKLNFSFDLLDPGVSNDGLLLPRVSPEADPQTL
jgi:hypothetical protein